MTARWGAAAVLAIVGIGAFVVVAARAAADRPAGLATQKEKLSYGFGVAIARTFQRQGADIDVEVVAQGMRDALAGHKLLVGDEDLRVALGTFQAELKQKLAQAVKEAGEVSKRAGESFLAENRKREGVVTLPSGLQYRILKSGSGRTPGDADTVECSYTGTRIDRSEFDSSRARGRPASFKVGEAIPGWREALKLMPAGSRWQLFVPPELAYGERGLPGSNGAPPKIGPNATLIFEVELVAIHPPGDRTTTVSVSAQSPKD